MIFYDTETCGFHGPTILIQWAQDDGEIHLHSVWKTPIYETLELIEYMMNHEGGLCGFNLTFDHFHLCQTYTTLQLLGLEHGFEVEPADYIDEYAMLEEKARDGVCLKPQTALDLMLVARKTEYQSTMDRGDIRIKKIPTQLSQAVADELERTVHLKDIYFARRKTKQRKWKVMDIHNDLGEVVPDFKDIVLKFAPSSGLKALAVDALGMKATKFDEVGLDSALRPREYGYAPFATAPIHHESKDNIVRPSPDNWYGKWPSVIQFHIDHWEYNKLARKYAWDDVDITRRLFYHFGQPEAGDADSILACMVGAVRWRGFKIDIDKIRNLSAALERELAEGQIAYNSASRCREYLTEVMNETERAVIIVNGKPSTKGIILEEVSKWRVADICPHCEGMDYEECGKCDEGIINTEELHPAAKRARHILDLRRAKKELENYQKLIIAGRFHASFKVIGTLSGRMSGADGLNAQGIKRETEVRECFPLAWDGFELCGGDFAGFEVTLADAVYGDHELRELLTTTHECYKCAGSGLAEYKGEMCTCNLCDGAGETTYKIHGIFGTYLFPGKSYEDISLTKGLPGEQDLYGRSKNGVFAMLFGGEAYTLSNRVGIPENVAEGAYHKFSTDFPELGASRQHTADMFCAMKQEGIGKKVEWNEPEDYIESIFGFRRYFSLENRICRQLFEMAENPPRAWLDVKVKVVRRERVQTACGSVRSALFAAAFALQSANMRAAGNHIIQSSGAQIVKELQARIWGLQPAGISPWFVIPANYHDEIMCPARPSYPQKIRGIVEDFVQEYKSTVPLLEIDWSDKLENWSAK